MIEDTLARIATALETIAAHSQTARTTPAPPDATPAPASEAPSEAAEKPKRRRGRPPKQKDTVSAEAESKTKPDPAADAKPETPPEPAPEPAAQATAPSASPWPDMDKFKLAIAHMVKDSDVKDGYRALKEFIASENYGSADEVDIDDREAFMQKIKAHFTELKKEQDNKGDKVELDF